MTTNYLSDTELLRTEIAIAAARMIAEDGTDYSTAKNKAAKQIIGSSKPRGNVLPDNAQIEDEVRQYNQLFLGESQAARLLHLRTMAWQMMHELAQFTPYLAGAVLNGTAGEHSDIHLQLFTDSAKDVEIYLLNKNVNFDVSETAHYKSRGAIVETISFIRHNEGVHLTIYPIDDLRGAAKHGAGRPVRADIIAVQRLLKESESESKSI